MSSNAVKQKPSAPTANPMAGPKPLNAPVVQPFPLMKSPITKYGAVSKSGTKNALQPSTQASPDDQSRGGEVGEGGETQSRGLIAAFLIGTAIALVGYSVLMPQDTAQPLTPKQKQKESERIEQLVNKHLVMTNTSIEIQQKKKNIELQEKLHQLGDTIHPRPLHAPPVGVDMSPDRNELNALNDLRAPSDNLNYHSPSTEIMREIADYQKQKAEEAAYNKAYREAIVAEARRQGFELQVGPDGQILGAKPIKGAKAGQGNVSK